MCCAAPLLRQRPMILMEEVRRIILTSMKRFQSVFSVVQRITLVTHCGHNYQTSFFQFFNCIWDYLVQHTCRTTFVGKIMANYLFEWTLKAPYHQYQHLSCKFRGLPKLSKISQTFNTVFVFVWHLAGTITRLS
ncbi:UNVERIFIED_CONTAM: hypothetical protein B566_EDAN018890 [Ephemera danica]|nr:hypothetical protein B566_EDAN018890 [Ephemera danica]